MNVIDERTEGGQMDKTGRAVGETMEMGMSRRKRRLAASLTQAQVKYQSTANNSRQSGIKSTEGGGQSRLKGR